MRLSVCESCYVVSYLQCSNCFKHLITSSQCSRDLFGLVTLEERREQMCLKFAKQCLKLEKMNQFFPRNHKSHVMEVRGTEFYKVVKSQTERFRKSAIPSMVKMLNDCQKKKKEIFKKLDAMPVNHVYPSQYHCNNNKL